MSSQAIRSLFRHSSIYGIGTVAGQAAGFVLLPLYTHYLTPTDYGIAAIIDVTLALAGITVGSGVLGTMSRFYHDRDDAAAQNCVVSTMFWLMAGTTAVVVAAGLLSSSALTTVLFGDAGYAPILNIAVVGLGLGFLVDTALLHLMITNRSSRYVLISLARLFMQIGFNVWFIVFLNLGVMGLFLSTLVTRAILILAISVPTLVAVGHTFSAPLAAEMWRFSFPIVFSRLFRLGATESDKYFINYFISPAMTGIYAVAAKIANALHVLVTASFLRSYGPTRFEIMKQESAPETYAQILDYYLLLVVTLGLGIAVFSTNIIRVMAADGFLDAGAYIPLMILAWIVFGVRYHFETGILIVKKTAYFAYINGSVAALSLAMNYVLIGRYGIWGALVALNVGQWLATGLFYIVSQRLYPVRFHGRFIARLAMLALAAYVIGTTVRPDSVVLELGLKSLSVVSYLLGLRLLGLVDDGVLEHLQAIGPIRKIAETVRRVPVLSQR